MEQMYEEKANGVKKRSVWYGFGEKSSNFFLKLEKQYALVNQVRTLFFGEKK